MPIMPFGAFKGKELEDVPSSYFTWLLDQNWFNDKFPGLSNQIVSEMDWREKWDKHIED